MPLMFLPDGTLFGEGVKSYNKTKPKRIVEFALEKAWWENRQASEQAWKVSVKQIKANG